MFNIIQKLNKNQRRYKTTLDNKLIDEALQQPSHLRMASVYVIVINRQNHNDAVNDTSKKNGVQKIEGVVGYSDSEEDIRDRLEQKKMEMITNRIQLENINVDG